MTENDNGISKTDMELGVVLANKLMDLMEDNINSNELEFINGMTAREHAALIVILMRTLRGTFDNNSLPLATLPGASLGMAGFLLGWYGSPGMFEIDDTNISYRNRHPWERKGTNV